MEKSRFLHLAFQAQSRNAVDHDRVAEAGTEVRRLWEELEASQKAQVDLRKGLVSAIGGVDSA